MKRLSSGDKFTAIEDASQERLLDLDGEIMEMGQGYWVKIEAQRVPVSEDRPAGVDYSLCLFGPGGERLLCYDNAHAIRIGTGPGARQTVTRDHMHKGERIKPYVYKDAESLLTSFWSDVDAILKERDVP